MSSDDEAQEVVGATGAYVQLHRAVVHAVRFVAHLHRDTFPDVADSLPDVVITVGRTTRAGLYGSFTPGCWSHAEHPVAEIFVNPAGFDGEVGRDLANQTFDTVAHELAHFINFLEDQKGTSRGGRWHNRRWAEVAHELGLTIEKDARCGHRSAGIRPSYQGLYADPLGELERALILTWQPRVRSSRATGGGNQTATTAADGPVTSSSSKYVSATCRCVDGRGHRRAIRVAAGWWSFGPITCDVCKSPFAASVGVSDAATSITQKEVHA